MRFGWATEAIDTTSQASSNCFFIAAKNARLVRHSDVEEHVNTEQQQQPHHESNDLEQG